MRPVCCLSLMLAMVGCGTDGSISGGDVSTYAEYLDKSLQASCEHAVRCGIIGASEMATCLALRGQYPSPVDSNAEVAAGRLAYDSEAGAACLTAYATPNCNDYFRLLVASCSGVLRGMQPTAATCYSPAECESGSCPQADVGCGGTCESTAGIGQSCQAGRCNPRVAFCDSRTSMCQALGEEGASCTDPLQCKPGLRCLVDANTRKGSCSAGRPVGGSCLSLGDCGLRLFCDSASRTCKATVGTGSPCASSEECGGLACRGLDSRGQSGVCGPWSDLGKPCDSKASYRGTGCPASLRCDPGSSTCVAFKAGDDCSGTDGHCGPTLACDGQRKVCLPRIPFGGACTPGESYCDWGTCDANTRTCKAQCG